MPRIRSWSSLRESAVLQRVLSGSSLCAEGGDTRSGTRQVFFTGVNASVGRPALALRRLASFRRPPVPAPFHFTIGRLRVDLEA